MLWENISPIVLINNILFQVLNFDYKERALFDEMGRHDALEEGSVICADFLYLLPKL